MFSAPMKTGGENVTEEVNVQTPLITSILESLVGKAQGANITPETVLKGYKGYRGQELIEGTYEPNGQYVWKRYNYTPGILYTNPSFKMEATTGASKLVLNNCTFDCTKITDWKTFFNGFAYNTNVRLQNSTNFYWWVDSSTTYSISGFNALSSTSCELTLASGYTVSSSYSESGRTYTYSGTKTIKEEIKIFMGYVVSDNESAYPDGGTQDGYWYEKSGGGGGGCIVQRGSVTLSSDNNTITIPNPLGSKDKVKYISLLFKNEKNMLDNKIYAAFYDAVNSIGNWIVYSALCLYNRTDNFIVEISDDTIKLWYKYSDNKFYANTYEWTVIGDE